MNWPIAVGSRHWGIWKYSKKYNMIWCTIPETKAVYEVDLESAKTESQRCDWLAHLAEKTWVTPEHLGNLVLAFEHTIGMRD